MDTADLKEYLGIVVDMEKNIYLQQKIVTKLENEINSLGKPATFYPPSKPLKPSIPEHMKKREKEPFSVLEVLKTIGLIALIIALIFLITVVSLAFLVGFFLIPITIFMWANEIHDSNVASKKEEKEYYEALDQYNESLVQYEKATRKYQKDIAMDKVRIEQELIKKGALGADLCQLNIGLNESQAMLSKIYTKNIIFPKYRNLIMVCSLYEYICSGRCSALEGHEGAYNILEMEIRLDRIITQLDTVITKLDQIRGSQFMLYSAIQDSNRQSAQILESTQRMADQLQGLGSRLDSQSAEFQTQLSDLQQSSALTAYQAERVQKELHYMNRMNYLSGKYDDVFFNLPPT